MKVLIKFGILIFLDSASDLRLGWGGDPGDRGKGELPVGGRCLFAVLQTTRQETEAGRAGHIGEPFLHPYPTAVRHLSFNPQSRVAKARSRGLEFIASGYPDRLRIGEMPFQ